VTLNDLGNLVRIIYGINQNAHVACNFNCLFEYDLEKSSSFLQLKLHATLSFQLTCKHVVDNTRCIS